MVFLAPQLLDLLLIAETLLLECQEDVLSDFGLCLSACTAEKLRVTLEPLIDFLMDLVILVTDLLWSHALLAGLDLRGSPILVGTAHEHRVIATQPTEAGKDICRQNASDDVA